MVESEKKFPTLEMLERIAVSLKLTQLLFFL